MNNRADEYCINFKGQWNTVPEWFQDCFGSV